MFRRTGAAAYSDTDESSLPERQDSHSHESQIGDILSTREVRQIGFSEDTESSRLTAIAAPTAYKLPCLVKLRKSDEAKRPASL